MMGNQTRKATEYLVVVPRRVPWLLVVVGGDDGGVVAEEIKRGNRSKGLGRRMDGGGVATFGKKGLSCRNRDA